MHLVDHVVNQTGVVPVVNSVVDPELRVQGELERPPAFGRQARIRENQRVELPREQGEEGDLRATGEWIAIDLPEEDSERWQHMVTVPRGRPVLLNALPDPERPGRNLVLLEVVGGFRVERGP